MQLPNYPILGKVIDKYIDRPARCELLCGPPPGISYVNYFFRLKYNPLKVLAQDKQAAPNPAFTDRWTDVKMAIYHKEAREDKQVQKEPVRGRDMKERYSFLLLSYEYWPLPEMEVPEPVTIKQAKADSSFLDGLPTTKEADALNTSMEVLDKSSARFELSTASLYGQLEPPAAPPAVQQNAIYSERTNPPDPVN